MIGKLWKKRDVVYLSIEFKNNLIFFKNQNCKEQLNSEHISNYNRFINGLDRQDQVNSYYPFIKKTVGIRKLVFI